MIEPFQQNFTVQELDSVFLKIVDYSKKKTKVIYGSWFPELVLLLSFLRLVLTLFATSSIRSRGFGVSLWNELLQEHILYWIFVGIARKTS